MKTNPNELAYPSHEALDQKSPNTQDMRNQISGGGLTKREYFAAMAMQGMVSFGDMGCQYEDKNIPFQAVNMADALIEALNKGAKE